MALMCEEVKLLVLPAVGLSLLMLCLISIDLLALTFDDSRISVLHVSSSWSRLRFYLVAKVQQAVMV